MSKIDPSRPVYVRVPGDFTLHVAVRHVHERKGVKLIVGDYVGPYSGEPVLGVWNENGQPVMQGSDACQWPLRQKPQTVSSFVNLFPPGHPRNEYFGRSVHASLDAARGVALKECIGIIEIINSDLGQPIDTKLHTINP